MDGRRITITILLIFITSLMGFLLFYSLSSAGKRNPAIPNRSYSEPIPPIHEANPSDTIRYDKKSIEEKKADNSIDFRRADIHALNAPATTEGHLKNLAEYLGSVSSNDAMKARTIFRWITANIEYDVQSLEPGERRLVDPKEILRKRRCVCGGYSALFDNLAQKAGIQSQEIYGFLKGAEYIPGESVGKDVNHSWNAIKLDGKWYLIDITLGGGFLNSNGEYISSFNDFYFLAPPEQLIFTHYPEKQKWQLLRNPISKSQFEELVFVSPLFFQYELDIGGHSKGVIKIDSPHEIKIGCPEGISLISSLQPINGNIDGNHSLTQIRDEIATTKIDVPRDGDYILTIFSKEITDGMTFEAAAIDSFNNTIQYRIMARNYSSDLAGGFPEKFGAFSIRNAYLEGPFSASLTAGKEVIFKIRVPGAARVAVVQGNQWEFLDYYSGMSYGEIQLKSSGNVDIMAQFPGKEAFEGLLRYNVKSGTI